MICDDKTMTIYTRKVAHRANLVEVDVVHAHPPIKLATWGED